MNIFSQFFYSLFRPEKIASFRFQPVVKTIFFTIFLSTLIYLPIATHIGVSASSFSKQLISHLEKDLHSYQIINNQLQSDHNKPQTITIDHIKILFDSSGKVKQDNMDNYDADIFFLKNNFYFADQGTAFSFKYEQLGLDLQQIKNSLPAYIVASLIFLFIMIVFLTFFMTITNAVFGTLIARTMNRFIPFRQVWNMSPYSLSLVALFFMIMDSFQIIVDFRLAITLGISLLILFLAMKETAEIDQKH